MTSITLTRPLSDARDQKVLAAARAGDEESFAALVDECQPLMTRLAQSFMPSSAVAEEVVHDAWLGVLRGLDGFEGRSTLRAWVLRTLVNCATAREEADRRAVAFASPGEHAGGPAVDPDRFLPADHPTFAGHWAAAPSSWDGDPEVRLLGDEVAGLLREAIEALPAGQRAVVSLRDVHGWSSQEVCDALGVTAVHQRMLLHQARSSLRRTLEVHLDAAA